MHPTSPLTGARALAPGREATSIVGESSLPHSPGDELTSQHRPQSSSLSSHSTISPPPPPLPPFRRPSSSSSSSSRLYPLAIDSRSSDNYTPPPRHAADAQTQGGSAAAGEVAVVRKFPSRSGMPNDSLYHDMSSIERSRNDVLRHKHSEEIPPSRSSSGSPTSVLSGLHQEPHNNRAPGYLSSSGGQRGGGPHQAQDGPLSDGASPPTAANTAAAASNASQSPPRPRRTRALMTRLQGDSLNKLWSQTMFPSASEREQLAQHIGLTARQVQVWFQNQRQKRRRERESDEAVAANAAAASTAAQTARRGEPLYPDETHWQRTHASDGTALSPRWPQRHSGPQVAASSSRYGQAMTMSSAVGSSSGPIPNFQQSYPPPIPSSPPRFPGTASPAAGYRRRPSTDELNSSQYYGIHHRDRRESASHGWKSPLTATSNSGGGHFTGPERPQRQRPGEKWPYRHNTLPWPSVPPRVSPEGTQVVSSSGRPYPSGRSFTFDEADVRRRDRLLESSPPRAPQSQPAPAVTAGAISTSPRHSNLPPSLAGLVLDPSVDTRLGDAPTVLSPINILAAKDLEPESPPRRSSYQHGHYSRKDESEERQSSSSGSPHDRPNQPAIPSIARLLN